MILWLGNLALRYAGEKNRESRIPNKLIRVSSLYKPEDPQGQRAPNRAAPKGSQAQEA